MTSLVTESIIDGAFQGWKGDTVFKLVNGQVWQQAAYHYLYHYAYRPKVWIYRSWPGFQMKVEGIDPKVTVRRLK
jgi:hypothetical protein